MVEPPGLIEAGINRENLVTLLKQDRSKQRAQVTFRPGNEDVHSLKYLTLTISSLAAWLRRLPPRSAAKQEAGQQNLRRRRVA